MIDEEAFIPAFASEIDSLESSDIEEYITNDTDPSCSNHSNYIGRLEHAIGYLPAGKKQLNMSVREGPSEFSESASAQRAGDTLCKGLDMQGVGRYNTTDESGLNSIWKETRGSSAYRRDQARGTASIEDELLTSMLCDGKKDQEIKNSRNIPMVPFSADNAHSSFSKDKPMFRQYLRNNETSEVHKPGSPIMPPKVAAMLDTEVDRETCNARANSYREDDLSAAFSPKIGLMGGTRRQNLQQTTRRTRSSKTKAAADKVEKESKSKRPTRDSSKAKQVKSAFLQRDSGPSELVDLSTLKPKTSKQKLLDKFLDESTKGSPMKLDKVAISPPFDPYKEVWHDKGPNQIYLSDSHYAANMMSAEVEWDLAQGKLLRTQ